MGSASTVANVPLILKNIWEDEIHNFMFQDKPLLGLMKHDTSWDGLFQLITVKYGGNNGRSSTFADAQANKGPSILGQMQIPTRDNFAIWSVDHKLITLSRNQRGALVRALALETEGAFARLKRSRCWMNWRNGGGAIATIKSIAAKVITVQDKRDLRNFEIGDIIVVSTDDGSPAAPAGVKAGKLTVDAIDFDAGTVTFVEDVVTAVPTTAAGHFLFPQGDYAKAMAGVPLYVPASAPGVGGVPTHVWGMDRTKHPMRLAGSRFTGTKANVVPDLKKALAAAFTRNIETSHLFVDPDIYDAIETVLGANRRYVDEKVGTVGYTALQFTTQGGKSVKCYSDPDIPLSADGTKTYAYGLKMDGWKFHTADEFPMWLNTVVNGGQKFRTEVDANASEGRVGGYGNVYTNDTSNQFVVTLS